MNDGFVYGMVVWYLARDVIIEISKIEEEHVIEVARWRGRRAGGTRNERDHR